MSALRLVAVLLALAAVAGAADPPPALLLTIAQALPGDRDLRLHLRWDAAARRWSGFATAPTYSRALGEVDCAGLAWTDDALAGAVRIRLASDGYTPKPPGETVIACDRLRAVRSGGHLAGEAVGAAWSSPRTVDGTVLAAPAVEAAVRLTLTGEHAIDVADASPIHQRLPLVLGVQAGRVATLRSPANGLTDVSQQLRVLDHDLRLAPDGLLRGTFRIEQRTQAHPEVAVVIAYTLDAALIGDVVGGRIAQRVGDGPSVAGWVVGGAAPAAAWGEGRCRLTLASVLGPAGLIDVYLALADGHVRRGFATGPNSGNAIHDIDASRLDWSGGRLRGPLAITVNPDPWTPGRQVQVEIDLTATDGEAVGTWRSADGSGVAVAGCEPDPPSGPITAFTLKCEDGLQGPVPYKNRVFVTCTAADGRITGGKIGNNHTKLAGSVTGGTIALRDGRLQGTVTLALRDADGVDPGTATIAFDYALVGRTAAGRFTATQDGRTKQGTGWIALRE